MKRGRTIVGTATLAMRPSSKGSNTARLDDTEESVFADFEESLFYGYANGYFSVKDVLVLAKLFFGPAVRGYLSRTEVEDSSLGKANRNRSREAKQRRGPALSVAARLLRETESKSQLARRVRKELAKNGGKPPPERTIRRWLDEIIPPKK
jgi:hypothetical protein